MSTVTHAPFEATYETTHVWLKELRQELGTDDDRRAYHALRAVLHALRDRLTVAEAADLGAQLPMLIRGLYYEGWTPAEKPIKERRREDFLGHITTAFPDDLDVYPEGIVWAVFKVLLKHVSTGEIRDIKGLLPEEIRSLWPFGETTSGE